MFKKGDEVHESAQEARQGVNVKGMTTVLWLSLGLVIVIFGGLLWYWL